MPGLPTSLLRPARGALLALLVALPACTCSSDSVNRGDVNLIPLSEEWRMGDELAREIATQVTFADDPVLAAYLEEMGQRIVAETEMAERAWTFYVVADPSVNAFAIPGGHVYVHTGLIAAAESADELAGVMAHEVAHVVARHGTERLTKVYGLEKLAQLFTKEDDGFFKQLATQLIGSGLVARFSRKDESEADVLGVAFMHEARYDAAAMATMFGTLLELRRRRPNAVERLFASHPLTERRIEDVAAAAAALPDREQPSSDERFATIQRRAAASRQTVESR